MEEATQNEVDEAISAAEEEEEDSDEIIVAEE